MSHIPEARTLLHGIARELRDEGDHDRAGRIMEIVENLMTRRLPVRERMPTRSNKITSQIKARILKDAKTTDLHVAQIAGKYGVNPGRVSEILQGDR